MRQGHYFPVQGMVNAAVSQLFGADQQPQLKTQLPILDARDKGHNSKAVWQLLGVFAK